MAGVRTLLLLFLLFSAARVLSDEALFTVQSERSEVALGDSFVITYTYRGQAQGKPDFSAIESNFKILGFAPASRRYEINGDVTILTQWQLRVEARQRGEFVIPPLQFQGEYSDALKISVKDAPAAPTGLDDVLLETFVDKSSAYVQEQIILTYRLYYTDRAEDLEFDELNIDNAVFSQLPSERYRRRVDGREYNVIEYRYAVLAQSSGAITIPARDWRIQILKARSQSFLSRGYYETRRLQSDEKNIEIKPVPDSFPSGADWLPARALTLSQSWSSALDTVVVGEPITRSVTITASGVEAAQLPSVLSEEPSSAQLKNYLEQPVLKDENDKFGLLSTRTESAAIVANVPGDIAVADIRIPWWNTETDALEYATIDASTLRVKPSSAAADAPRASADVAPLNVPQEPLSFGSQLGAGDTAVGDRSPVNTLLLWLIAGLVISNMTFAAVIWYLWQKQTAGANTPTTPELTRPASDSLSDLKNAAQTDDATAFYHTMMKTIRKEFKVSSYKQLVGTEQAHAFIRVMSELEQHLFSPSAAPKPALTACLEMYRELRRHAHERSRERNSTALVPLAFNAS